MKYFVFGAGYFGEMVVRQLVSRGNEVLGILDNDVSKHGKSIEGIIVSAPDTLTKLRPEGKQILIAILDFDLSREVCQQLTSLGFKENVDFRLIFRQQDTDWDFVFQKKPDMPANISILNDAKIDELVVTDCTKYPLVMPWELSPKMLRSYSVWLLDVLVKLDKTGHGLADAYDFRFVYCNNCFFVPSYDFVCHQETSTEKKFQILEGLFNPLILISKNQLKKGYMYLENQSPRLEYADIKGYLTKEECRKYEEAQNGVSSPLEEWAKQLRELISNLSKPFMIGMWSEGYKTLSDAIKYKKNISHAGGKYKNVIDMIRWVKPRTLIDLAGNVGFISFMLRGECDYCITTDIDWNVLDDVFDNIGLLEDRSTCTVLPLYSNILYPTPGKRKNRFFESNTIPPTIPSQPERLRSEMAIALAVVHHLLYSDDVSFEQVICQILQFTYKHLVIEYVDIHEKIYEKRDKTGREWWTRENFEKALSAHCDITKTSDNGAQSRILYLCTLKKV